MAQNNTEEWLLPSRGFVDCFGCAPHNTKGLKLRIWYTKKGCISYYTIPEEYCGFTGLTHGGIIATLMDEVAAWTIITHLRRIGITLQVNVRYLKPVPTGVEINIEGVILENNEENVVSLARILSKKGTVLAEAESRWLLPDSNHLQKITGI
ncbi:MAG: PaaI family thioesterase, partial [Candidatus Heimdallarchaeota archaeon]